MFEKSRTDPISVTLFLLSRSPPAFLSPPGYSPDLPMGDTWTAFVKHDQFWNLCHAPQRIPDPTPIQPIQLRTGLLGGIADSIFSSLLAPGNNAFNSAL